ncbi:MAG: acyl carrier protein [Gemmatimonadales bacterium]|nr:MAG: acyl carrier protein [Gemmatimonadales bacterium]
MREALRHIAPEVELDQVDPTADLRDEIDLDSVDAMNLLVRLHESLGVEIPESDYSRIATLDGMVTYLEGRLAGEG